VIDVYAVQNNTIDVLLTMPLGILGYVFMKLGYEPAALLLMAAVLVVIITLPAISKKRETVFVEEE
jgi:TctA family transporter